ncbi:MAG: LacI family DNA-binding transcriptional regulator [Lachnospiraceae bacterium]|nr:LacI family DNA-binding transcriptional regulator [Lachnospiraceae bacterium]
MSIKDVAKAAGVSPSTVSRVINSGDRSAASPKTQQKIWEAVREQGYIPNQNARNLKCGTSSAAPQGQFFDCIYARLAGAELDPFFTILMHEAEIEALNHGYHLRRQYSIEEIQKKRPPAPDSQTKAALVLGRVDEASILLLKKYYRHLICMGLQDKPLSVDQVLCRGYDAAKECIHYLHSLGHTKICYFGETRNEQRYDGYLAAMAEIGISETAPYIVETSFSSDGGYAAVRQLIDREIPCTAIFCASDLIAGSVLKALKERKIRVPQDISVIGINDMETVRYLDPMLTAIAVPMTEMGKHAAKLLIDRINGGHKLPAKVLISGVLVQRESCSEVKK